MHRLEVVKHAPRRTDRQNRYFHPCFCDELAKCLTEQGQFTTLLEAKEIIKAKCLRLSRVHPTTGEVIEYVGRTRDLNISDFNAFLDRAAYWLNDVFGIIVPDPDVYREKAEPMKISA